jgi:hypothetical protein
MSRYFFLIFLCCAYHLQAQVVFNGNITEPEWGMPLGTSVGGPTPCFGNGFRLNSLFASANNDNLMFGIGGNVQAGSRILLFIDSKPGGYNNGNFGRSNAPGGLANFNGAIIFDEEFLPDYCLSISPDIAHADYVFQLYTLSGTKGNGGGPVTELGSANTNALDMIGTNVADNDNTKGFEIGISRNALGFNAAAQQEVKLMAMLISDAGFLDNQFVNPASYSDGCFSNGAVDFRKATPDPASYKPDQLLPITFTYFRFVQRNSNIILLWASAIESNLQKYELQHSQDAVVFNKIGEVNAMGTSSGVTNYEFPDRSPQPGKNFYRVKAIDKMGRSAYSPVVKVQYGFVDNTLGIFPNPVKNSINLQLIGLARGTYNLTIYNDAGQRMMAKTIEYNGGYGLQQIPLLPSMTNGPYRLLLSNHAVFFKQNFVVQ